MRQKVKVKERIEQQKSEEQCNHYWDIEAADGPVSRGVCKRCGETREFFNSFPDFNSLRKPSSPFNLPNLPDVEIDEDSKS